MSTPNASAIQSWLVSYVAREIKTTPEQIPVDRDFVNLGLSSRNAVAMMADLEDFIGHPMDPGLAWEHPNIRDLSNHLSAMG